jgi:hypothetical protein
VFLSCGGPHESQFHHSALMVFANALEETFKDLDIFQIDWPSSLKVMMYCFFHFAYLSCSCHIMDLVFYQGLSCVYHCILPCPNTTDWHKCIKKERKSTNELLTRHTC